MSTSEKDYIEIDLDSVIRERLPRYHRFIPGFLIRALEKAVCQDRLNEMLRVNRGRRGADFCRGVLEHLRISYRVNGAENLPADPRAIFVCNHPLGGLDGMMLIDMLTRHYGRPVRFVVNDLLMAIEPLRDVFLPMNTVNNHGRQSREATEELERVLASDAPVIIFPAGLVSRKNSKGVIADLQWRKMFVNRAISSHRDIIPLHFSGHNSKFFYNFANLRTRLGIPFNLEMTRLPAEVFRCEDMTFSIEVGSPIAWSSLEGGRKAAEEAAAIRRASDALAPDVASGNR